MDPNSPHFVDSRFGLYHVAAVLSFLRSPISLAEIVVIYIFGSLDLSQILRLLAAFSLCGSLQIVCSTTKPTYVAYIEEYSPHWVVDVNKGELTDKT